MKKIRNILLLLLCFFSSVTFFACEETIKVDSIYLNSYDIVLRPGEEFDLDVEINPLDASDKTIEYFLTSTESVELVKNETDNAKAKIKAKSDVLGTQITLLQVKTKDGSVQSDVCKITVYTQKTKLLTPQNLTYDNVNQTIKWDKNDSASGYKLVVEVEGEENEIETICATNSCKIDSFYNKEISVKVQALGDGKVYENSDFSNETFKFIQLMEPQNLENNGFVVSFDRVENAKSYNLFVFENAIDNTPEYTFNILNNFEQETVVYNLEGVLNNAGKTYFVKAQALPKDSEGVVKFASTYNNYISISKFATPTLSSSELKFDYSTNTISWKNHPSASGYVITRYLNGIAQKAYTFSGEESQTNFLKIDTAEDKLQAGEYYYKLKILGNDKNYISSNEGEGLKIEKLSAPKMYVLDGIVCWNAKENIGGYKLKINDGQTIQFSSNITSYSFKSTTQKTFIAGSYDLLIASVGNGVDTITSDFSQETFTKLAKNELPTVEENRYLTIKVNSIVSRIDVTITNQAEKINEVISISSLSDKGDYKQAKIDLQSESYPAGTYLTNVVCYAEGYLTSDASNIFEFYKLSSSQKAKIENNQIKYEKIDHCGQVEVVVSSPNTKQTYKSSETDFKIENIENFVVGEEYKLKLRYYPSENNYIISNYTDDIVFEKLKNEGENLKVEDGIISEISSTKPVVKYEFKEDGATSYTQISSLSKLKIEDNKTYQLQYFFVGYSENGKYYLESDRSEQIEFKLKSGIENLERIGDEISFSTNGSASYMLKFSCGTFKDEMNVKDLSSYKVKEIDGQEKIIFSANDYLSNVFDRVDSFEKFGNDKIKIYVAYSGSISENEVDRAKYNKTSCENISNTILFNQELTFKIVDLKIENNEIVFSSCGAESYRANVSYLGKSYCVENLSTLSTYSCTNNSGGEVTISLEEFIKSVFAENYESIASAIKLEIVPVSTKTVFVRNQENVSIKVYDNSNAISVNVLQSPKNFKATKLIDLSEDSSLANGGELYLNELFFVCGENAEYFELTYTNSSGVTRTKILSLDNFLYVHDTSVGKITYRINSSFLEPDTYSFSLRSVASKSQQTQNGQVVYNINGFDKQSLSGITKISAVTGLEFNEGVVTIVDTSNNYSNCGYLLVKDGEIIYDDVLGTGQDLNYIINLASSGQMSDILSAYTLISKFKEKTRSLPSSCTGTFTISAIKVAIPQLLEIMTGGEAIKSEQCAPITLTRLDSVKPVLKNGILEWNAVTDAESYTIYGYGDLNNPIKTIVAGEELKFDVYNHLNGVAGNYSYVILAKTTKENYLQSLSSRVVSFEILSTPTLSISGGKVVWTVSSSAQYYKLEVFYQGEAFDELLFDSAVASYDAKLKSDKETVLESGEYEFRITALGASPEKDETTVMKSLTTSAGNCIATKLDTPSKVRVEKGLIVMQIVNNNTGVDYYNLKINNSYKKVASNFNLDGEKISFELDSSFNQGNYFLSFEAVGKNNYLSSNFSEEFGATKLGETSEIYILNGEIYWKNVDVENYLRDNSSVVKYKFDLKRESSIYGETTDKLSFMISEKDESEIPSNIYSFAVKVLGDDSYYLNGNETVLKNVVKLGKIKNIRIENGTLCWTNPLKSDIAGLNADTKVSPNGIELILEKDGNKREFTLQDGTSSYKLNNTFTSGNYYVSLRNVGDSSSYGTYNFTNGHLSTGSVTKLQELKNLNIQDGINLSWTDENSYSTEINKVLINITQYIDSQQLNFSGVVEKTNNSIRFEDIKYYEDNYSNKILVLVDSCDKDDDGNLTYNGKQVKTFSSSGYFRVNVVAFGDNLYVNSDESNSIEITRPDPVTNLEITNGKVTWKGSDSANGFILTITRKDYTTNTDDSDYNLNHEIIYVQGKECYNLTDVNYFYTVSVKAYSLVASGDDQTIASDKRTIENYLFNTFSAGDGTGENPYIITGEDELINIKYNNFATYSIKSDIVFTKYVSPLFDSENPFIGKIEGNGYTIENLQITDGTLYGGLFGYISSGEMIDDRIIDGERTTTKVNYTAKIDGIQFTQAKIVGGCYVGIVAGYSSGTISNIIISSSQISSLSEILTDVGASMRDIHSGSIVGENYGTIEKCSVESATINPTEKPKRYSGGICAENYGTILACKTSATVYGNVSGGVCATNYGTIDFVKFGGSVICENYVLLTDDLLGAGGGVCAYNEENGTISNCLVRCDLSSISKGVTDASQSTNAKTVYVGGLVGDNNGLCYNNCIEINLFRRNNTISCVLGKIFGYNYNNEVFNNYVLYSENTQATVLCEGAIITGTNKEITAYTIEIKDELENKNKNKDYSWIINISSDGQTGIVDFEI